MLGQDLASLVAGLQGCYIRRWAGALFCCQQGSELGIGVTEIVWLHDGQETSFQVVTVGLQGENLTGFWMGKEEYPIEKLSQTVGQGEREGSYLWKTCRSRWKPDT